MSTIGENHLHAHFDGNGNKNTNELLSERWNTEKKNKAHTSELFWIHMYGIIITGWCLSVPSEAVSILTVNILSIEYNNNNNNAKSIVIVIVAIIDGESIKIKKP